MLFRRHHGMSASAGEALSRVLAAPTFELVPLKGAIHHAAFLPPGARVSVTASPIKGIEATVELCGQLEAAGFRAVPHLSARMVRDRAHLADLLASLEGLGVERAFVVGGDAKTPGEYPDGLSLLRAMKELHHHFSEVGIPCYPQGHPFIADEALLEALHKKAAYASYMTSQLCFDPAAIGSWLTFRRSEGVSLPLHVGMPGVTEPHRLLAISARLGVADTHRFLTKNIRFVARLVRSGGYYRPDALLEALASQMAEPRNGISGLHLYTFNAVEATETWRRRYLAGLVLRGRDPTADRPDPTAAQARHTPGDAVP
ncbi:MAG: methylenetetrahydrofolate reductase [Chloroflexota bacterium]|nr:methylenetetrahydrofolate reductase [Chloroflexota bacterium]